MIIKVTSSSNNEGGPMSSFIEPWMDKKYFSQISITLILNVNVQVINGQVELHMKHNSDHLFSTHFD